MAKRENWSSWYEFLFSCIGCVVGLGNIWRFPYLCYKNGGGAFLIPYVLFLFLVGVPITFLQMSYCQFSNLGPAKAWICVPLLRGIGSGMVATIVIVAIYYNVIIAWTIRYFVASFSKTLPWSSCDNPWNTNACYLRSTNDSSGVRTYNITGSVNTSLFTGINNAGFVNYTGFDTNVSSLVLNISRKTATEEFWDNEVLERSSGFEEMGAVKWQLLLCLFGAWVVVVLCLLRGIKSSGKVMYVAATLPYLLLLILLCRAATLDGAADGLRFYMIPKWERLGSIEVWGDAAVQMFYSMGVGGGAIGTLASYNKFHNNIQRDTIIIAFVDLFTSWFSGIVIFISLGFMAKAANLSVDQVVSQGPGVAFVVYPEALSQLPLPQLWSVIFFLMLIFVGLDSQIVHIQVIVTTLTDHFPRLFSKRRIALTAGTCFLLFILGIPCVTQGGVYVLQIMDWYLSVIAVVLIPLLEMIGLTWFYGVDQLCNDIQLMIGYKISIMWKICWKFLTPLVILMIWVFGLVKLEAVSYGGILLPGLAVGLGWFVGFIPVSVAIIPSFFVISRAEGDTLKQKIKSAMEPHEDWGPADETIRSTYKSHDLPELVALNGKQ